jgi:hypothetical protein
LKRAVLEGDLRHRIGDIDRIRTAYGAKHVKGASGLMACCAVQDDNWAVVGQTANLGQKGGDSGRVKVKPPVRRVTGEYGETTVLGYGGIDGEGRAFVDFGQIFLAIVQVRKVGDLHGKLLMI